jgi:hypothetical protein
MEAGDKPSPPQSQAFGKSLAEWLVSYFTWALGGDQTNPDGRVLFLPIPASEPVSGSGKPDDPLVLVGHADVTVKPGTPFVLPIAVFIGELYGPDVDVPFNPDPEVPESVFEGTDILITLDGKPIIDSTTEDKFRYYVPPQYFGEPIFYDEPTSSGSDCGGVRPGFRVRASAAQQKHAYAHPALLADLARWGLSQRSGRFWVRVREQLDDHGRAVIACLGQEGAF